MAVSIGLPAFMQRRQEQILGAQISGRLLQIRLRSSCLRRVNTVLVYLPPGYTNRGKPYPVAYLLHGFPGQATDWFAKGQAHLTADREIVSGHMPPMMLVSFDAFGPGGPHDATQYLNKPDGSERVEDYVCSELPNQIERQFNADPHPCARALIGLSSGGFGAVNLGLKHPDVFRVLASHSGFFDLKDEPAAAMHWLGPRGPLWERNSPLTTLGDRPGDRQLHVYLDCGLSDRLLDDNKHFSASLNATGIDHILHTYPGGHTWRSWRRRFNFSIAFVGQQFRTLRPRVEGASSR